MESRSFIELHLFGQGMHPDNYVITDGAIHHKTTDVTAPVRLPHPTHL